VFLDVDAKPVLDWAVPDRYAASWNAYNPNTATYSPDFVNPLFWSMNIDGCASTSIRRITGYAFTVAQVGSEWTWTRSTPACELRLHNILPAQGIYRLSLVLHTDMATAPGVSATASRIAEVRDYLIVSMGDSLASGEGNPDVPGSYHIELNASLDPISIKANRPVQWKDPRCHRSAKSGPSLAAKAYEDASRYTSVTFLSVACSGAELRHLISERYKGMDPQVDAVRSLVGGRPIDSLLISAGVNDLDFSGIIKRCVLNSNFANGHENCVAYGGITDKIYELRRHYAYLALALQIKLPNTREIYLNDYPSNVFRGGACGLLAGKLPSLGLDDLEGQEMDIQGTGLSSKIIQATDAFREYRWNYIGPLALTFHSRAYCNRRSWFTSLEGSLATQGDVEGTAHPNAAGHVAYGKLISRAMVPNQAGQAYRQLTVTIEAVKASALSGATAFRVDPVLWEYQNDRSGLTRRLSVPRNGEWTPVPASVGTFDLAVFVAPASPRHAIELRIGLGKILPIHHTYSDGFGVGSHVITHPAGLLAVRYRVVARALGPPGVG
jgi:hypothetical protein